MKVQKKVLATLNKCYSIAPLQVNGKNRILVAAEKQDPCFLFDDNGEKIDTVWSGPGGVMTMVQLPGSDGAFLATQEFYSPNDSKNAKIVLAEPPHTKPEWSVRAIANLAFVHRFDVLRAGDQYYLFACTLKSGHEYKEDWSSPGKVWACVLPEDLSSYNEKNPLVLKPIKENLLKNHGYCRLADRTQAGVDSALVCADNGVYVFTPPSENSGEWSIEQILNKPASDAVLIDIDEDGKEELLVLSPFHGEQLSIYKNLGCGYEKVWDCDKQTPFLHAITIGKLGQKPAIFVGCRKGERSLLCITWDKTSRRYTIDTIDTGAGPANVMYNLKNGQDRLFAANRETDEIALYTLEV